MSVQFVVVGELEFVKDIHIPLDLPSKSVPVNLMIPSSKSDVFPIFNAPSISVLTWADNENDPQIKSR